MNYYEFKQCDIDDRLKATVCSVECTHFEQHCLWQQWVKDATPENRIIWQEILDGWLPCVGAINVKNEQGLDVMRPIHISTTWAFINGAPVLFWHPTSIVVEYDIIENWLKDKMPQVYRDSQSCATGAQNFHIIIHRIAEIALENNK